MANGFHTGLVANWLKTLSSDKDRGLAAAEAHRRIARFGENRISAKTRRSKLELLAEQFKNLLVLLLVAASLLSFVLGSVNDGAVLFAIVVINALVGFFQDWKSENIAARLGSLVTESTIAVRDGARIEVPVASLVPGDIIYLQEGDGVPADCRIIAGVTVMVTVTAPTGKPFRSKKSIAFEPNDVPLP